MDGTPPTPPAEDEVKWQVALFALMPLILGAMSQPVGRVLDKPAKYRLWMRASPIFCITDILHFVIGFVARCIRERKEPLLQLREELRFRFQDEDLDQTLKDVERTVLVRWLMMGLGGIPCQTVKLVAMQGIPLTRVVALMFAVSILFGEMVVILASTLLTSQSANGNSNGLSRPYDMIKGRPTWATAVLAAALTVAEATHHTLTSHVTVELFHHALPTSMVDIRVFTFPPYYVIVVIVIAIARFSPKWRHGFLSRIGAALFPEVRPAMDAVMAGAWAGMKTAHPWLKTQLIQLFSLVIRACFLISYPYSAVFSGILVLLARITGAMHGTVMGRVVGISDDKEEHDHLVRFLWLILVYVLYYAYLFDGAGTVNPSWTGIFG
ncbi:hypothetical protein QBC47DRAFT_370861 [Echria macrotheca]|uniref:Uncharacterized protein n=1 Tax=Echria macrotheca TaxID=438768 RepID=A0AAJ0FFB5_9PEZI|nr:hypothetical protein QBC47DRAFT_370861 [Echria macrotheca]